MGDLSFSTKRKKIKFFSKKILTMVERGDIMVKLSPRRGRRDGP